MKPQDLIAWIYKPLWRWFRSLSGDMQFFLWFLLITVIAMLGVIYIPDIETGPHEQLIKIHATGKQYLGSKDNMECTNRFIYIVPWGMADRIEVSPEIHETVVIGKKYMAKVHWNVWTKKITRIDSVKLVDGP